MEGPIIPTASFSTSGAPPSTLPQVARIVDLTKNDEEKYKKYYKSKKTSCTDTYTQLFLEVDKIEDLITIIDFSRKTGPWVFDYEEQILTLTQKHHKCQKLIEQEVPNILTKIEVLEKSLTDLIEIFQAKTLEINTALGEEKKLLIKAKLKGKIVRYQKYQKKFLKLQGENGHLRTRVDAAAQICQQRLIRCASIIRGAIEGSQRFEEITHAVPDGRTLTYFTYNRHLAP